MISREILQRYPFLRVTNSIEEYVEPSYYNKLLKSYSFGGKADTDLFKQFIDSIDDPSNVLELCSGSGRISSIVLEQFKNSDITLTDLSGRMLSYTREAFSKFHNIRYMESDAVDFLYNATEKYDLVYTLWGFSHSVHQHIHDLGLNEAKRYLVANLSKFILENIIGGGKMYLVHFDSMSDEQRILMRQWKRVYKAFSDISTQSPSKRMIDEILNELDNSNAIILKCTHLMGDPIVYKDIDELMEIYMNFHLETYFNDLPVLEDVVKDIEKQAEPYKNGDGTYSISPGCYIYELERRG